MPALIWLSYSSLLILSLLDNLRSPYFPEILADFHLNGIEGSLFFAVASLLAFVGSWSSHRILKAKSSLFLLGFSSVLVGLGYASIAISPDFVALIASCALFGWGFGALNLAQNVMIFEAGSAKMRRRLFSGLHATYGFTALVGPLLASLFRMLGFSWRQAFLLLAGVPFLILLASSKFKGKRPVRDATIQAMTTREWGRCLLFSMMTSAYLWGEISASSRTVLWLRNGNGFSPDMANLYLAGFFMAFFVGRVFFSFVHVAGLGNWLILCVSSGFSAIFYGLTLSHSPLWLVLTGLSLSPFFPVALAQAAELFKQKSAQALGFILGFGSLSVVLLHLTIGYCTDLFGIRRALFVGPISLFAVFLALLGVLIIPLWQRAESK